ncbi:hypothetical protein [Klebsiella aerogenes]|uniref:hypothetical protein n=1 Tax=Klebsiella aerogenes TaxID=548 RepID=UPI003EB9C0CE
MLFQQIYLFIGGIFAGLVLMAGSVGRVRVRNDGSQFALIILVFLLWPICILLFVADLLIDKLKNKSGKH